jgi:hypothetical protein
MQHAPVLGRKGRGAWVAVLGLHGVGRPHCAHICMRWGSLQPTAHALDRTSCPASVWPAFWLILQQVKRVCNRHNTYGSSSNAHATVLLGCDRATTHLQVVAAH